MSCTHHYDILQNNFTTPEIPCVSPFNPSQNPWQPLTFYSFAFSKMSIWTYSIQPFQTFTSFTQQCFYPLAKLTLHHWFSTGVIQIAGDSWQCLEASLVVSTVGGGEFTIQRPRMLLPPYRKVPHRKELSSAKCHSVQVEKPFFIGIFKRNQGKFSNHVSFQHHFGSFHSLVNLKSICMF